MFKALFFDLDETLIAVMKYHLKAQRLIFEKFNIDYNEVKKRTEKYDFLGRLLVDILKIQKDSMQVTEKQLPLAKLTKEREKIFLSLVEKKASLLPGAKHVLKYFKKQNKIIAISSSGTRKYINLVIDKFNLKRFVDFIVGEEDVSVGKPDPQIYLVAYQKARKIAPIKKDECLVFEDSPNGVIAAKSAGLKVCYIPFFNKHKNIKADYYLKNLKEINKLPI